MKKPAKKHGLTPPKKGGKPKRITGKGYPGGPHTPGAKKARARKKT